MKIFILITLCCVAISQVYTYNYVYGNVFERVILANKTLVEYRAMPFIKRVKMFFYSNPSNQKIAGIQALDTIHSKASINITAGGVGHPFVNLRMKSERGKGLYYDIGIYVEDPHYRNYH